MKEIKIQSKREEELLVLDEIVNKYLRDVRAKNGVLTLFCPHTTAGLTMNENGDPNVKKDLSYALDLISPKRKDFQHFEGNSHAHVKASLIGPSLQIIYQNGQIQLGTWQSIYFWEFDGPRHRKLWLEHIETRG
ncbi:MAG: secondary thiamine-phosphate synthase enzyme YjbQ [Tissierellia bacterium]|nr:secondary thiamine-phosphate synthase enzyme YjbQ [Tissierellia bacterium]